VQLYTVYEKRPTLWLSISLLNIHRFSKLFCRHIFWTVGNKAVVEYSTTP